MRLVIWRCGKRGGEGGCLEIELHGKKSLAPAYRSHVTIDT
jgi:hypothetical protein